MGSQGRWRSPTLQVSERRLDRELAWMTGPQHLLLPRTSGQTRRSGKVPVNPKCHETAMLWVPAAASDGGQSHNTLARPGSLSLKGSACSRHVRPAQLARLRRGRASPPCTSTTTL